MKRKVFSVLFVAGLVLATTITPTAFVSADNDGDGVVVYGILSAGRSGNLAGSLYEIDVMNRTQTLLYENLDIYPHPYGNGLAFDEENGRLYFTLSTSGSVANQLWFYDFAEGDIFDANPPTGFALGANICGAAFGDGYYWYIPDNLTSLRRIAFNPDGTYAAVETVATLSPAPGGFGDIVYRDGIVYGSTQTRYFTYDIAADVYTIRYTHTGVTNAHNHLGVNVQLAWGSDEKLYGHSYLNQTWWEVEPATGNSVQIPFDGSQSYGDLASGPIPGEPEADSICGHKYLAGTTTGLAGWRIILERLNPELEPPDYEVIGTTTTAADGSYCFTDLPAGEYRIRETLKPGWRQVQPTDPSYHQITLPANASHPEDGPFHNFHNREDTSPPTAGWQTSPLHMTLWTSLSGGLAGAGLLLRRRRAKSRVA